MEEDNMFFVEFDNYCKTCKNFDLSPTKDPCNDCLDVPSRMGTRVPEYWEEKDAT